MQDKNSVVTAINPDESFEYKGETYFKWEVSFENGDSGEVNTKKNQPPWSVGDEADYTIVPSKGPYPDRIKKVWRQQAGGFSGGSSGGGKSNNRSFALSYAKDLVVSISGSREVDEEDIVSAAHAACRAADVFIDWLEQ